MTHAEALADFILCLENDSPGFLAIRNSMIAYRQGAEVDWPPMVSAILEDKALPIVEMLLVGLYEIWNASLAFEIH